MFIILLSIIVGCYIIQGVTHALHAPLMSVTNLISSIVIIGSIKSIMESEFSILSYISLFFACINIGGGFKISDRMVKMFQTKS